MAGMAPEGSQFDAKHYDSKMQELLQSLRPDHIKMFVLDEADEMLSRGFKDQNKVHPNVFVNVVQQTVILI
jgi:ATP:corrinoid adenosyltransferase